jgi:hypothetical protein
VAELRFPRVQGDGGPRYWLRVANIAASQRKFSRLDHSIAWRKQFENAMPPDPPTRVRPIEDLLLPPATPDRFRFVVMGDTGEGDHSQYGLVPLIRATRPDFMIINGDAAYPAGSLRDFELGFFQPYANLNVPVWATIGNHEYYSPNNGREFYQIFCTRMFEPDWVRAGLRLVPQPGTFWELSDPLQRTPLVIIGVDSGKAGNLDGHESLLRKINPFDKRPVPDVEQHAWLEQRLRRADASGGKVLLLFHIPGLVGGENDRKARLGELHRIVMRHPSVRAVVCAHVHNHQQYDPATFRGYVEAVYRGGRQPHEPPHYVVSGNGGATLEGTEFRNADYRPSSVYPSVQQWQEFRGRGLRALERSALGQLWPVRALATLKEGLFVDADEAQLRSFLMFDVIPPDRIEVSLIFMNDINDLFSAQPSDAVIAISDPAAPMDPDALQRCTLPMFQL